MRTIGSAVGREGVRIAWNSALLTGGNLLGYALGMVTIILITDQLQEDYGLLLGAQRFAALFAIIIQFGLRTLVVREVASGRADAGALLGTVLFLRIGLGAAFATTVLIGAEVTRYLPESRWLLYAFVAMNVIDGWVGPHSAVCEGLERMGHSALIVLSRSGAMLIGTLVVVAAGGGLIEVIGVYLGSRLLQLAAGAVLVRRAAPGLRIRVELRRVRLLFRESPMFLAVGLTFTLLRSLDVVLLTRLADSAEAARYGAALNFVELLLVVPLLVQRALLPTFSRLAADASAPHLARRALVVFSAVLLPSATALGVLADGVVALYPSGGFADSAPVLRVLAAAVVLLGPSSVFGTLLTSTGRLGRLLAIYIVSAGLLVSTAVPLIPARGAMGAAYATLAGFGASAVLLTLAARGLQARLPWAALGRHILATAGMALPMAVLRELPLLVPATAGALAYAGLLRILLPADALERQLWRQAAARWRR